jgi:DNA-binding transcriptional ArsR family regulator
MILIFSTAAVSWAPSTAPTRRTIMEFTDKVLDVMRKAGEPLNAGKVAELGGLERKAVDKAMEQLKKEGKIISPRRCFWTPS